MSTPNEISLAVLPLRAGGLEEHLADGFTESLIQALSRLPSLRVTGRTSAFAYRGRALDLRLIGQQLGAGLILEGSLRRVEDIVALKVQLVETVKGSVVWADSYRRAFTNWFELETEISTALTRRLLPRLHDPELALRLAEAGTQDAAAYDHYLRGLREFRQFTPKGMDRAGAHFDQAIELDPGYAAAYAARANIYHLQRVLDMVPTDQIQARTLGLVEKALELGPQLGEAWLARGVYHLLYSLELDLARHDFDRALRLSPGLAETHEFYSFFLSIIGEDEACIQAARRAVEIDPLSPSILSSLAYAYFIAGRSREAIDWFDRTLELLPGHPAALESRALVYLQMGDADRCKRELLALPSDHHLSVHPHSLLGLTAAISGDVEEAKRRLASLKEMEAQEPGRCYNLDVLLIAYHLKEAQAEVEKRLLSILEKRNKVFLLLTHPFLRELRASTLYRNVLQANGFTLPMGGREVEVKALTQDTLTLSLDAFLYAEARDNYTTFYWLEGDQLKSYLLRLTIKAASEQLTGTSCERVHRSFLVNLDQKWGIGGKGRNLRLVHQQLPDGVPLSRDLQREMRRRFSLKRNLQ